MDIRKEVSEMKEQVENVKEENRSFAMELTLTLKTQAKRWFICWFITFAAFIGLLGYTIWLLNDIEVIETETTQEITDVQNIENSTIRNGN